MRLYAVFLAIIQFLPKRAAAVPIRPDAFVDDKPRHALALRIRSHARLFPIQRHAARGLRFPKYRRRVAAGAPNPFSGFPGANFRRFAAMRV